MNRRKPSIQVDKPIPQKKSRKVTIVRELSPLMSHVGFQGGRHLHPDRLPTKQHDATVSLRIFDTKEETIENVQKYSDSLKRLLVSGIHLKTVPESLIDRLTHLEKLDLSNNQLGDGAIPDDMKKLEKLSDLALNNNKLTKVPPAIKRLKYLARLDLSTNGLDSLKGLEKNRRMQILVLDNNKVSNVFPDISHMQRLEVLKCKDNVVKEIECDVRNLRSLRDLDLSGNSIVVLPSDVFFLPKLEYLSASQNKISKVPVFNIKVNNKHEISDIDLSGNKITKFPGHLLRICKRTDLSSNKIKNLNINSLKNLERDPDKDLIIDDNPLVFPPADMQDLRSMMIYMHEERLKMKVYRGVKVVVLGSHQSGKTSLIQSLIDQQGVLSEDVHEAGAGIESYDMSIDYEPEGDEEQGKSLNLCIWDFCGHAFYRYPHYLFFEQPSIAILTFDMKAYSSEEFDDLIASWFDWMMAKTNKIVTILVGTHGDLLTKAQQNDVIEDVKKQLAEYKDTRARSINERIQAFRKPGMKLSKALSEHLVVLSKLQYSFDHLRVPNTIIMTSSKQFVGFDLLRQEIEKLARSDNFPNVMQEIKTFWVDAEDYIEEKGVTMVQPVMTFEEFRNEVDEKFGMRRMINAMTEYLHEKGKVLNFSQTPSLKEYVFVRPLWLFELLRQIYHHDISNVLSYEKTNSFKAVGMSTNRFERTKSELLSEGVIDRELLQGMIGDLVPTDMNDIFDDVIKILLEGFCIGYPVAKLKESSQGTAKYNHHVKQDDKGKMKIQKILIPWLRKIGEPEDMKEKWQRLSERKNIRILCKFPIYFPPGFFETLCIRIHQKKTRTDYPDKIKKMDSQEKVKMNFMAHWGGGIHARNDEHKVHIKIHYVPGGDNVGTDLLFELRADIIDIDKEDEAAPGTMWNLVYPLLFEFEETIKSYEGILVERRVCCPLCNSPSFVGEWQQPKQLQTELQDNLQRKCEACKEMVETDYLIQPRGQKTDDINDVLKEIIKQRQKRRAAVADQKSLADLIDQENRQYTTPSPSGRRSRGAMLPTPDLSQLQLLQSKFASPEADDDGESTEEPRQNGFPIETLHNNIDTPSNSAYQDLSDLDEVDIEQEVNNDACDNDDDMSPGAYGYDEYTQTSPQTNISR
ncbi:malignant fibrous histiocytoma-amplified sequence 1 homolog isoform X1 [Mytilus edulis]|uniref:malignant fibrous histiocytoma-amplified sequence 1 homolog isoform X1 n=1 Tax=Mytilus edulis TaxID=6550 RepID=UPI0039EE745F